MVIISIILLAVVLLAQISLFILFFAEKRRSVQRNQAMLDYVEKSVEGGISACQEETAELLKANCESIDARFKAIDESSNKWREDILCKTKSIITEHESRTNERLNNMLLDYSQAQEAASRINDFGANLANIFDYDPLKAIQKGRKKEAS